MWRSTGLVVVAASVALAAPRIADACSQPACWFGGFAPGDQGRVPANVPGLYWRPMLSAEKDPANVVLLGAAAPTTPIAFTAQQLASGDFLLIPHAPLAEGSYTLTDRNQCMLGGHGPSVTFTVGPAADLPASFGPLIAAPPSIATMELATVRGTCSSQATVAEASIGLAPSLVANPWLDVLHFETLVDGAPWHYQTSITQVIAPGASATGRARDRVFQICATDDASLTGLAAGQHVVTMRASLPGTATAMMTSDPLTVTLRCDPAGEEPPGDPESPHASGGCSAGGAGAGAGWLAALGLLGLVGASRRRR